MSINSNLYYTYKRRLEEAQRKPISQIKERVWLLENLAKELLNDLASEWLSEEEYEKEVGIIKDSNR